MSDENKYVPRLPQIDAIHLNKEIDKLIRDILLENIQNICPRFYVKVRPELDLIIQSAIWFGSIKKRHSSFGQQLLALSYDSQYLNSTRLRLHFLLTVLPGYLRSVEEYRLSLNSSLGLYTALQISKIIALGLSVLNFFRFFKTGKKPSLVDLVLDLNCVSIRKDHRDVGYKYLGRELLWGGFMETFGLIASAINFKKIQMYIKRFFPGLSKHQNMKTFSSKNYVCSFCGEKPTLPHYTECKHMYCYYCISANILTDPKFGCTTCGSKIFDRLQHVELAR